MAEKNNWLICGTSPFAVSGTKGSYSVNNIGLDFSKFTTVALNWFPIKCDYRFIMDCGLLSLPCFEGEKLVINNQLLNELKYHNHVGQECFKPEPFFVFEIGRELDCINSVCEPAIEYAYKQGADNIILFGVDLTADWQNKERTDVTKAIIRGYNNVYTLNKKAEIGVPTWTEINLN